MGCCGGSTYRQMNISGATIWWSVMLVALFVVVAFITPFLGKNPISGHAYLPMILLLLLLFAVAVIAAIVYNKYYRPKGVSWDRCGTYALFTFLIPVLVLVLFLVLMNYQGARDISEQLYNAIVKSGGGGGGAGISETLIA